MNPYLSFSSDNGDLFVLQDAQNTPDINENAAENIKQTPKIFEQIAQECVDEMETLNDQETRKANHLTFAVEFDAISPVSGLNNMFAVALNCSERLCACFVSVIN